jgi:UDP-N-acetylglucosamine 2-epimerase (non-hydrolysing)
MPKLLLVAGARPNFMKIAPILRELEKFAPELRGVLVHTGQHYDRNMSETFFQGLGIKKPEYNLDVGSGSHALQTATIMIRFEEICLKEKPDLVMVVGDVNSTIATGLVAKKLQVDLAHIEAGLRSGDRTMPEEINRIATDAISDLFFTTEKEGTTNLLREGQAPEKIHFVGHVMIDNLFFQLAKYQGEAPSPLARQLKDHLPSPYICVTLHRPSNVDQAETLTILTRTLAEVAAQAPIIFPCHPRTRKQIERFGLSSFFREADIHSPQSWRSGIYLTDPLGYDDFLYLWRSAALVLTDSGGLQEETTALKIPCLTLRDNTERPITAEIGSNVIVGQDPEKIRHFAAKALAGAWPNSAIPDLWDGQASARIITVLRQRFGLCR